MSVWNMNSSQIVAWVADQFKGQVIESKCNGIEIIPHVLSEEFCVYCIVSAVVWFPIIV